MPRKKGDFGGILIDFLGFSMGETLAGAFRRLSRKPYKTNQKTLVFPLRKRVVQETLVFPLRKRVVRQTHT